MLLLGRSSTELAGLRLESSLPLQSHDKRLVAQFANGQSFPGHHSHANVELPAALARSPLQNPADAKIAYQESLTRAFGDMIALGRKPL